MNTWPSIVGGAVLAAVLFAVCIPSTARRIEADLTSRGRQALAAAGIPAEGLSFEGRSAVLKGFERTSAVSERAVSVVRSAPGVLDARTVIIGQLSESPEIVATIKSIAAILRTHGIEFELEKADLTKQGANTLDLVAEQLARLPELPVVIAGYSDSRGNAARNLELSERRAAAVKRYLVGQGFPVDRLESVGYGSARPIADNSTLEGRRANRRIEFHVKERQH